MKLLAILTQLLTAISLFANTGNKMKFSQIETEDGLPSNTVQCIFQESQGMMWF